MNNPRRKEIGKAMSLLEEAKSILEAAGEEEQEYADEMPENMLESEKHDLAEERAYEILSIVDEIDDIVCRLDEVKGG